MSHSVATSRKILAYLTIAAAAWMLPAQPSGAQEIDKGTVDTIIGSQVKEEEKTMAANESRVADAIEKTAENTARVRKLSKLETVDIVFLSDATRAEGGPPPRIEAKIKDHDAEITEFRKEIEGNAMLYHAIESRQILPRDVLAVEFVGSEGVVIFAAAKPAK